MHGRSGRSGEREEGTAAENGIRHDVAPAGKPTVDRSVPWRLCGAGMYFSGTTCACHRERQKQKSGKPSQYGIRTHASVRRCMYMRLPTAEKLPHILMRKEREQVLYARTNQMAVGQHGCEISQTPYHGAYDFRADLCYAACKPCTFTKAD